MRNEALEKLEFGDTEEEVYLKDGEVINRVVVPNSIEEHPLTFRAALPHDGSHAPIVPIIMVGSACARSSNPQAEPRIGIVVSLARSRQKMTDGMTIHYKLKAMPGAKQVTATRGQVASVVPMTCRLPRSARSWS